MQGRSIIRCLQNGDKYNTFVNELKSFKHIVDLAMQIQIERCIEKHKEKYDEDKKTD